MKHEIDQQNLGRVNDSIELDHPVDFLIFTNTFVNLSLENSEDTVYVQITERVNNQLILCTSQAPEFLNLNPKANATLVCPYRSKKLAFEIIIDNFYTENNIYFIECEKPKYGYLIDDRGSRRAKFNLDNQLTAAIEAETIHGLKEFKTNTLVDYSMETMAISIDRAQGLLLPNDYIPKVQIYNSESELLFETSGQICRVVYSSERNHADTYIVVIKFLAMNKRPVLDIHPNERRSERILMNTDHNAFIEFTHPFTREKISAYVMDLSNSGLSVTVDNDLHTLIPGLFISNAQLQLPLRERLIVHLKILEISSNSDDGENLSKISMTLVNPSSLSTKEINSFVQKSVSDNLVDAKGADSTSLLEFFFESGFIYENKRRQIQKYSNIIRRTQKILLDTETPLCKTIVYKQNGVPMGTGTALKIYDGTLLLQHLNAKSTHTNSGEAARSIIRGMTTFFLDEGANKSIENRYVCTYFQPNNLFPSLVFGESANLINNKDISWTMQYKFCVMSDDVNYSACDNTDFNVHEAETADLAELERILISQGKFRIFKLEDMSREGIKGMRVFDEYNSLGLYRYRKVFVSRCSRSNEYCYAVCNYSSPGMNLSELTNSVKFYFTTQDQNIRGRLINSIIPIVTESYMHTEMQSPVLLLEEGIPVPFGFKQEKVYMLWSMDLNYPKLYKESVDMIFGDIKQYIRNVKAV